MLQYNEEICKCLHSARIFKDTDGHHITSIDITADGRQLVATSEDEGLRLYDCCEQGELKKTLFAKKYGVGCVRFLRDPATVICASSNEWDFSLRYWNLQENRYLRYLKGHRARVVGVEVSPKDELVISASADSTIRLWDVRSDACAGLVRLKQSSTVPSVSFDDQGLVFAVLLDGGGIGMYDLRSFDTGPFETFKYPDHKTSQTHSLKFSTDGRYILMCGGSEHVFLVDSFSGSMLEVAHSSSAGVSITDACVTPDSKFIVGGAEGGSLHFWPVSIGGEGRGGASGEGPTLVSKEAAVYRDTHSGAVSAVKCSPCTMMIATACRNVNIWVPDLQVWP